MTNLQTRLLALPLSLIACAIIATQPQDEGIRLFGGALVLMGLTLFFIDLRESYRGQDR